MRLDLAIELPRDEFGIGITREAEFEIAAIIARNPELKAYIDDTIARCAVKTDSYFGFFDDSFPQEDQRIGGFDVGRWASKRELEFIAQQQRWLRQEKRKTKLYVNEADISGAHQPRVACHIGCQDRGETAGLAHVASPAAKHRPDRKSSRSSGLRKGRSLGTTRGVVARSRETIARASSSRPIWA
jgi:hypothetical protein